MASRSIVVVALAVCCLAAVTAKEYPKGKGAAVSTRMWDCCKPTCAWDVHAPPSSVSQPVLACAADGVTPLDKNAQTGGVDGGVAFMCHNQAPFIQDGQAYAFAAARVNDLLPKDMCCTCYKLTFTSTALAGSGKHLIVQVTNTGTEYTQNHFDLEFPAGGAGLWPKGCLNQFPWSSADTWGGLYGGIRERWECDKLPEALRERCRFRWDWFENADNPNVDFERIPCPKAITDRSGCKRHDD